METIWYLYTLDGFTNEALSRELVLADIAEEPSTSVLYNGKKISVWRVPFRFAALLERNRHTFPFSFIVLVQEGGGKVRRWHLQGRGKISRSKRATKARREIKRLKQKEH